MLQGLSPHSRILGQPKLQSIFKNRAQSWVDREMGWACEKLGAVMNIINIHCMNFSKD